MAVINCNDHEKCLKMNCLSKNRYLIHGEEVIKSTMLINCFLTMTNYRLYLIYENMESEKFTNQLCHVSIPLRLILKIEQLEMKHLRIFTKIGGLYILSFDSTESCALWMQSISDFLISISSSKLFAFQFYDSMKMNSCSILKNCSYDKKLYKTYDYYLVQKEFDRMKFDNSWQITDVNNDFKICQSYPRFHIVPGSITNEDIRTMAEFRGNKRFPSVVWRSQKNGAVLIRCAQPQVGLMCWRNSSDEKFFKEVMKCLENVEKIDMKKLLIIDARHYSTAQFNRIRGGGVEFSEYYGNAEIMFMQLENIHNVRSSFDYISAFAGNSETWLTSLESSYWLKYLSKLLKSASDIARALNEEGRSVIIHCSDGWDRTPQLTSLSQILLDGYYRSIEGFQILIEKEWLQFGHKFADRCGFDKPIDHKERSPVFVQWLDCVHQLIKQYPRYFEFNETFLIKLAIHIHSGLFGNFLYNTEEERIKNKISDSTTSIWNFLSESNETIINPLYYKNTDSEQYQFYDKTIYPKYNTKFFIPWNKLFFEALSPLDSYRILSIDSSSSRSFINHESHHSEEFQKEEEIAFVPQLKHAYTLRKSKSETDMTSKKSKVSTLTDDCKPEGCMASSLINCDLESTKYNGHFINQTSSTSTLNDSAMNGFVSEISAATLYNDIEQKLVKTNKFRTTELLAYSNGILSDLSKEDSVKSDSDISTKEFLSRSNNSSMKECSLNKLEDQHFRSVDTEDSKEIYMSSNNVPCDLDGLYLFIEPINQLAKQWNSQFNAQKSIINQLQERLNCETQNINKVRTDSASSIERCKNEDSISSHESFIILESPEHVTNHCERSTPEVFSNTRVVDSKLKLNNKYTFDSSDHCHYNKALFAPSYLRRSQPCDTTTNGSEKAQA